MKIKTDYIPGDAVGYLTAGKEYSVCNVYDGSATLVEDDCGDSIGIDFKGCRHLNGGNWIVVGKPQFTPAQAQEMYDFIKELTQEDYGLISEDAEELLKQLESNDDTV